MFYLALPPQEYAANVMADQKTRVLYESTDNVMKYGDFEKLCQRTVPSEVTQVLSQQLLRNGQLVKKQTEHGYEVVKLSQSCNRGLKITDIDVGIVQYVSLKILILQIY